MLIVALYMNDLPVPSAQVIHPMPNGRFSWDGNLITVPSLITQCIHNPSPCCFIWASLTTSSTEISTYGSFFKSLKSQVYLSIFPATSFPVFCLLGTRLWHQVTFPRLSLHRGPGLKGRACSLNPSPRV